MADEIEIGQECHRPVKRRPSLAEVLSGLKPLDEEIPAVDDPPTTPEDIF